jgi:hypothetical protein
MRNVNPYEIRLVSHRDLESCPHRTSVNGGGK